MKKFSKIVKVVVAKDPEKEIFEATEEDLLKRDVRKLLDNCLSVQMHGPVNRYAVAGLLEVKGKEMFLEALFDMLKSEVDKKSVKILESMKSTIQDWEAIDNKVSELNKEIDLLENTRYQSMKSKVISLYKKYKDDEELIDESVKKITNAETALYRSMVADRLSTDSRFSTSKMKMISDKYSNRSKKINETHS